MCHRVTVEGLSIRDATHADADRLAAVYRDAYAANVEAGFPSRAATVGTADVETWIHEHDRDVFLAENPERNGGAGDEAIVGSGQLRRRSEWRALELGRLAVVEAQKRRGIGDMLLDHGERVARDRGHDSLRLRTFTGHPVLPDWYDRRGYERVGRERLASRPYDVLVMEKRF